jgi:hypothetical protein
MSLDGTTPGGRRQLVARVDNSGTISTGTGAPLMWVVPSGASITNSGLIDMSLADMVLNMGAAASLTNSGTFTIPAGRGLVINGGIFIHPVGGTLSGGGLITAASGTTLVLQEAFSIGTLNAVNSTLTLGTAVSTASLAMSLQGVTINGSGSITNAVGQGLTLNGVTFGVPLTNDGTLIVSGNTAINAALATGATSTIYIGQIDGSVSSANLTVANGFTNNGAIELTNFFGVAYNSSLTVTLGTLVNAGAIVSFGGVTPGGQRTFVGRMNNSGTLSVGTGAPLVWSVTSGAALTNSGLIDLSLGSLTLNMGFGASLTSAGTVDVVAPFALTVNGGTFTHAFGATLSGGGALTLNAVATGSLQDSFTLGSISVNSSTLTLGTTVSTAGLSLGLSGSTINGTCSLINAAGQTLTLNGSTLSLPLTNQGTLIASANSSIAGGLATTSTSLIRIGQIDGSTSTATLTVVGSFTNQGAIEITNSFAVAYNAALQVPSGTLTNSGSGTITALGGTTPGGTRTIFGIVDNQGTIAIAPGAAYTLTINGSLTNSGTLALDLGGTTAGTTYDQLVVTGAANLGGALDVGTFSGFQPNIGNSFTVITRGSGTGGFATINVPPPSSGAWNNPLYNPTSVVLSVS